MIKLLAPGMRLKRWILMFLLGIASFIIFLLVTFGEEFDRFIVILNMQLSNLLRLPVSKYYPKLIIEFALFGIALIFILFSLVHLIRFLINALIPEKKGKITSLLYRYAELENAPKVVVIGGGTGLNSILRGLKDYTNNITAVVSVSDEGGSSRRLRYEYGVLPPGDIRNCIVALSDSGPLMAKLLEYRFREGTSLTGHSFGNLMITALTKVTGSFEKAVLEAGRIFAIRGQVLPVTLDHTTLCAELENGKVIEQEPNVEEHKTKYKSEIRRLFLKPGAKAYSKSIEAIKKADVIVLGPGSLYTSIIPNLLVKGIPEAIRSSGAKKVYVCNVMTQPGETDNYGASDHVGKVVGYLGKKVLDYVIVNTEKAPESLYRKYQEEGSKRVKYDPEKFDDLNVKVIGANLMTKKDLLRHDPDKLAKAVLDL
ncbi:hypothetical protein COV19_01720 [Candidatus Woesearchaeota archaeon CG10_big_fil_rev_8_21_14_0_10_44_13]|nr:MAG: hypothetical protein COV19_01720 [Candidatus Woesearchaeota archaeon CG10_big_fil_rev_8_21_14_0_10_44_13]